MARKLTPLSDYDGDEYPKGESRAFRGLLVAAAMTATSLGGCGPGIDSRTVDDVMDSGDLDGAADACDAADPNCEDGGTGAAGSGANEAPAEDEANKPEAAE